MIKKIGGITFIFLISFFFYFYKIIFLDSSVACDFRINIKKGTLNSEFFDQIDDYSNLEYKKVLKILLKIYFRDKKVIAGSYFISKDSSLKDILDNLIRGKQKAVKFTFSSANDINDFINQVSSKLDIKNEELQIIFRDKNFLNYLGFSEENILVMFIPNTYEVYWNISAKNFFLRMFQEYKLFWSQKNREDLAKKNKLTPIQVSILASIIQRETNKLEEASKIAGVYINRYKKKIPLCSCPSVKKNISGKEARRILKSHIKENFEGNTYKKIGIPKEPLCMPRREYIDSVLKAEQHNFFYFCAREDFSGFHNFAYTFKEHIKNSVRYKKKLNELKIFR